MKHCRFCKSALLTQFVDLVSAPPSNSFLKESDLILPEAFYPLKLYVCDACKLVQVDEYKSATEIFDSDYVYFSSFSKSWLEHCQTYAEKVSKRFKLNSASRVVEIASNDGYLLQYFKERGIPTLGIEPTESTATVARQKGIETISRFFGRDTAADVLKSHGPASLIAANNVLAHVPDLNDFVAGFNVLLAKDGVVTVEFPHLLQMVKFKQFDTIYHEHFSYLSFYSVQQIFAKHGLRIFDVEEIPTHGGSLRIYADHGNSNNMSAAVDELIAKEDAAGIKGNNFYKGFQKATDTIKNNFITFLIEAAKADKKVAGYGAAAKGNTLLNYCGVKNDLISFVADASPHKQGRFLPGSRIPVVDESLLKAQKPDYVVILPWNIKDEITKQLSYIRDWGGKFVTAVPSLEIF